MTPPLPASSGQDDQTVAEAPALVPKLTKFDKRVLSKLDVWGGQHPILGPGAPLWRTPWQVAEILSEDDVTMVRRVLRGLEDFGHAASVGYGNKQRWVRREKKEDTE